MSDSNKTIAIIGGGAAGMMAAATLVEEKADFEIHIFEKNNRLGVKVAISGGGRCNVTTGISDERIVLSKYIRGSEFLKPAMVGFSPKKVCEWFEENGVKLKEEKDKRIFPVTDNGQDIVTVFENIFSDKSVKIHFKEGVESISVKKNDNGSESFILNSTSKSYLFDYVIITTGGNAYARTGSNGEGYNFAKQLGHSISQLGPSLNSFETINTWCKELSGISFPHSKLLVTLGTGEKKEINGPILFTHFGITGPAVFAMAAEIAYEKFDVNKPFEIRFIPIEDKNFEYWENSLQNILRENNTKQIINSLSIIFPQRFCEKILEICKINPRKKSAEINKVERQTLSHLFSGELKIFLKSRRIGDEFVTAGGVELNEINRKTMQSRLHSGLYFAGEVLNIDGLTGGFNLQAAWATGRLAGKSIFNNK